MLLGLRSPFYWRKPNLTVNDATALVNAGATAAGKLSLMLDGSPQFNSNPRHRKSAGFRVKGNDGIGWLKIYGSLQKSDLCEAEAQSKIFVGVTKPEILNHIRWFDAGFYWQAVHMSFIHGPVISETGNFLEPGNAPDEAWLMELKENLTRIAKTTQPRTSPVCAKVFGFFAQYEGKAPPITELVTSHGDLHWANLTSPFCILDWERHGYAPRGHDPARLLAASLAAPALCARLRKLFKDDLESPSGVASQIWNLHDWLKSISQNPQAAFYKPFIEAELERLNRTL